MATNDLLAPLLAGAGIDGDELGEEEAASLSGLLGVDREHPLTLELLDEFARIGAAHQPADSRHDTYGFRVGDWKIGLGGPVRVSLLTAMVAGALHQRGLSEFTIGMATAVLPTVLEVRKAELSAGDKRLLLELNLKEGVRSGYMTEDELYASLPSNTRTIVNRFDFADFVAALRDLALVDQEGELVRIRGPEDRRPLISFHD